VEGKAATQGKGGNFNYVWISEGKNSVLLRGEEGPGSEEEKRTGSARAGENWRWEPTQRKEEAPPEDDAKWKVMTAHARGRARD